MVFNNTKVIPAELKGCRLPRDQDAPAVDVSLTLLERLSDGSWRALSRPARRLRVGDTIVLLPAESPLDPSHSTLGRGGKKPFPSA